MTDHVINNIPKGNGCFLGEVDFIRNNVTTLLIIGGEEFLKHRRTTKDLGDIAKGSKFHCL
jgi:hypothetical protein